MNAAVLEAEAGGWSRSRWVGALSLIVLLHLLGLFIFSKKQTASQLATPQLSNIYWVEDPGSGSRLAELLSLQDPMVFTKLDPQGLSRVNLLAKSRFSYEVTNWTEPYRWLPPSDQYFADDFNVYVADAVDPSTLRTEKMAPILSEVSLAAPILPAQAVLRIEGDLAGRRLIANGPLPVNESSAVLTNTVVRVVVDSAGEILGAALIFGSGWPKTDQNALAFARQSRFERTIEPANGSRGANSGACAFGRLVFQWFPLSVNAASQLTTKP